MRKRGASDKIDEVAVMGDNNINEKEILSDKWPYAKIVTANDTKECVKNILRGKVDGGLFMTYTAQNLAREDIQNRLRADIVPGVSVSLRMGINSQDKLEFCGIWKKTLASVSAETVPEITQIYAEQSESPTMASYLFDNPVYMIAVIVAAILIICLILLYIQSENSKRRQVKIMERLTEALEKAEEATAAKQNFFSKMSHDIRTPLNVVLGMSVVKGFLELMDGKMDIKSVLGQGSIFTIEIPFKKATQEQCDMILRSDTSNDEHGAKFTGKKVLLVEDNALNAEIAMELIYTFGLSVDWAENGLAGVNRLTASSQGEYFAVFMDMQMPVMDGVSAAREIRASSHPDSNIPIFAMTANTFASDRKLCSDADMNGYISKPVNIEDIKSALNKCLTDGINND